MALHLHVWGGGGERGGHARHRGTACNRSAQQLGLSLQIVVPNHEGLDGLG